VIGMVLVLTPTTGNLNRTKLKLHHFESIELIILIGTVLYFCSTKTMRNDGGYEEIKSAIQKLGKRHKEHIAAYGEGNERRLTGRHETADINTFLWVSNKKNTILCSFGSSAFHFTHFSM